MTNNLATLYVDEKSYDRAESLYLRSLNIREKTLGPKHPDMAVIFNNLAELYVMQHRYAEAEPLYQRALAIQGEHLGPNHLDLARTLNGYALLLRKTQRKSEASLMRTRVKEILARVARSSSYTVDARDHAREREAERK